MKVNSGAPEVRQLISKHLIPLRYFFHYQANTLAKP